VYAFSAGKIYSNFLRRFLMAKKKGTAKNTKAKGKAKNTKAEEQGQKALAPKSQGKIKTKAQKCRETIESAMTGITKNFFELSAALNEAYGNDYAAIWGFENFRAYVEEQLEMKYRRAMYLVSCGQAIEKLGLKPAQVEKIGWTRFKEVAPRLLENPDAANKYLDMAEKMSTSELKDALKEEDGVSTSKERKGQAAMMRLSMKFEGDAMSVVSDALNLAYSELGSEEVGSAFNHICAEWLMTKGGSVEGVALEDWLTYLEKTYGVKLQKVEGDESIDALLGEGEGEVAQTDDEDAELEALLGGEA
jgi:hypothetical protein